MNRAILVLAFLGTVLVSYVAQLVLPDTPVGQALGFLVFGAALFPLARMLWFSAGFDWKYAVGFTAGALVVGGLEAWRRSSLPPDTSVAIGQVTIVVLTVALVGTTAWRRYRRQSN